MGSGYNWEFLWVGYSARANTLIIQEDK